jgi:thioredoxin-like negative regulator of GroEL
MLLRYTLIAIFALLGSLAFGDELIIFHMPGCRPCGYLKAMLAENPDLVRGFTVSQINISADPESAKLFNVSSVPTIVRLNEQDQEVARTVGYDGKQAFARWLENPARANKVERRMFRRTSR